MEVEFSPNTHREYFSFRRLERIGVYGSDLLMMGFCSRRDLEMLLGRSRTDKQG